MNRKERMLILYSTILLITFLSFFSCKKNRKKETIREINVVSAYENRRIIKLSDIAQSVEYIQLSSRDSLVGVARQIFIDPENIIVVAFKQQFLFRRKTGEFIREIGQFGRGPNGYRFTRINLPYNESRKTIYSGSWKEDVLEYALDGRVLKVFQKPRNIKRLGAFVWANDSVHVCYAPNFTGDDTAKLLFYNRKNDIISTISTNDRFERNPNRYISWGEKEGWFYRFDNRLFFKELFNDTIFEIKYKKLVPKYEFFSDKYKPDSYKRNYITNEEMKSFYLIENFFESANFLFFTLNYKGELRAGLFDKRKKEAYITDSKKADSFFFNIPCFGFNNDIDNFIQFYPQYINENNELIASVDAFEISNWFNNNKEKISQLSPYLQNLKNIKENDNPIIMIAKLKD